MNERVNLEAIEVRIALAKGRSLGTAAHGDATIELLHWRGDLLAILRRGGKGGLALRVSLLDEEAQVELEESDRPGMLAWRATSAAGRWRGRFGADEPGVPHFVHTVRLTPRENLHVPYLPRDLVPFAANGNPMASKGEVMAMQRKLNTGLCFVRFDRPALGTVLYVQNLTALNPYYRATGTAPDGVVGGEWPVLGYLAPTQAGNATSILRANEEVTLYDTRLVIRSVDYTDESASAWQFLDMLGLVYRRLDKPRTTVRDWPRRARRTLRDLQTSPKARSRHFGETYFHPYTNAENPDSMVQLSLLSAVRDWSIWTGEKHPLENEIARGLARFHCPSSEHLAQIAA